MARVVSFDTIRVRTSFPIQNGDPSSLNAERLNRMLRELGCISYPLVAKRLIEIQPAVEADRETFEEADVEQAFDDAASHPYAESINQALEEMMARILVEQRAITETRIRAAAGVCAKV